MRARLCIAPIAGWNDDLAELSDDVSLEECLRQASVYSRRFPENEQEQGPGQKKYGLSDGGEWFAGLQLGSSIGVKEERFAAQMAFFKMAVRSHKKRMRVMNAAGYEVVQ